MNKIVKRSTTVLSEAQLKVLEELLLEYPDNVYVKPDPWMDDTVEVHWGPNGNYRHSLALNGSRVYC